MLSPSSVLYQSKNFTSDNTIRMPPTVPFNHYTFSVLCKESKPIKINQPKNINGNPCRPNSSVTKNRQTGSNCVIFYYSMLMCSTAEKRPKKLDHKPLKLIPSFFLPFDRKKKKKKSPQNCSLPFFQPSLIYL